MWGNLVNKYVVELSEAIKIQYTQINITHVLTTKQAKYKNLNRTRQAMSFWIIEYFLIYQLEVRKSKVRK